MTVKIIIPEYGQRKQTQDCLRSIDKQKNIMVDEIVIGNDGYEKPQIKLCSEAKLRIIDWEDNLLFGANLNRTAAAAFAGKLEKKDIIILVNNDVIFHEDCISELCNTVLKHSGLHGPLISNSPWWEQDITRSKPGDYYTDSRTLSGCCFALFACNWFELGGIDCESFKSYFEENDLCIRAKLFGLSVGFTHRAKLHHKRGQTYRPWENKKLCQNMFAESHSNSVKKWGTIIWKKDNNGKWQIQNNISPQDPRVRYRALHYSKHIE